MAECPQHTFQILTKRSQRLREMAARLPWPENVWMGASVEDARVLDRAIHLATVPAAVRFLSCEPLIGPLDDLPLNNIDWVIVGGESGPRARAMSASWVKSIRRQCRMRGVAFFFKQWGGVRKDLTGRLLDGRTYDEMPRRVRDVRCAAGRPWSLPVAVARWPAYRAYPGASKQDVRRLGDRTRMNGLGCSGGRCHEEALGQRGARRCRNRVCSAGACRGCMPDSSRACRHSPGADRTIT